MSSWGPRCSCLVVERIQISIKFLESNLVDIEVYSTHACGIVLLAVLRIGFTLIRLRLLEAWDKGLGFEVETHEIVRLGV